MSNQFQALLSLGVALLLSASAVQAQSADAIIKKHNEAVGGEAWKKVNSVRLTGNMSMMGMEFPLTLSKVRNTGVRREFDVQGTKSYVILTPTKGWSFIPPQGMTEPKEIPAEELQAVESELFLGDLIMEMGDHGYKFESAGISTLDGKPVTPGKGTAESDQYYRIKALDAKGNATDLYIDMNTNYLVKTSRMIKAQGQEVELAVNYTDYLKQDGVVVPMTIKSEQMGDQKFTKLEVNPAIEAAAFKP